MRHPRQRSLNNIVFIHEAVLLCLLVLAGLIGGGSAYFWHSSAAQSLRIHTLLSLAEQIRGEIYAQTQEAFRVRILEDEDAWAVYTAYSESIDDHFNALRRRSNSEGEDQAIQGMQRAYRELQRDMNRVAHDPYRVDSQAQVMILNPGQAARMIGRFEQHHGRFKALLGDEQHQLDKILYNWSRFARLFIPLLVGLAILLVFFTRRAVYREFISPMSSVIEGAQTLSQGSLEYRIPEAGVREISSLARVLNGMAADLKQSQAALLESERQAALGALVPVVAHNIRNPLASIRATAQLIDANDRPAELLETRRTIISTIDRLGRWVNALVSYLHPLRPRLRPVPASVLLEASLDVVSEKLRARDLRVRRAHWQHDRELQADPDLMEQALYALIQNAVDASPAGGELVIAMTPREDCLEMHIIDQGPGLPFKPVAGKLQPGPSTKSYGTGLGIPIAFRICQAHGWNIVFADVPQGAEVIIAAPLRAVPAPGGRAGGAGGAENAAAEGVV